MFTKVLNKEGILMKKLTSLILAVAMILFVCAFAEEVQVPTPEVMTYDEYIAAAIDDEVCVETYVQAHQTWWDGKITLYTQNEEGAYFVYNAECDEATAELLVAGTPIRVCGYKAEWSGEIEIADATIEILDAEPWIAEPVDVTELLGTDELIDYQNQLVAFTHVTIEPYTYTDEGETVNTRKAFAYKWNGTGENGDDLYFNVSVNGQTYIFTIESNLCAAGTEIYETVKSLEIGEVVDMWGFLYWYNGVNPHIVTITRG